MHTDSNLIFSAGRQIFTSSHIYSGCDRSMYCEFRKHGNVEELFINSPPRATSANHTSMRTHGTRFNLDMASPCCGLIIIIMKRKQNRKNERPCSTPCLPSLGLKHGVHPVIFVSLSWEESGRICRAVSYPCYNNRGDIMRGFVCNPCNENIKWEWHDFYRLWILWLSHGDCDSL